MIYTYSKSKNRKNKSKRSILDKFKSSKLGKHLSKHKKKYLIGAGILGANTLLSISDGLRLAHMVNKEYRLRNM